MGKTFLTLMSSSLWRNIWGLTHVLHVFLMEFIHQNNQVKKDFHGKEVPPALLRPKFRHQAHRGEPRSHFSHCPAQAVKIVCCQRYHALRNPSFFSTIILSDLTLGSVIIGSSMFARHSGLKQWEGAVTRSALGLFSVFTTLENYSGVPRNRLRKFISSIHQQEQKRQKKCTELMMHAIWFS